MNSTLRPFRTRQFLTAGLLVAMIIAVAVVWLDRRAPAAIALDTLDGPAMHDLVTKHHAGEDREICGMARIPDIEAVGVVPHGLASTSEVPVEAVALIEFSGARLEDYEQRHFDTHRLLLISWDATSRDLGEGYGAELGSVYELHYLEDETSIGWSDVYWGNVHECRPEDLAE